MHIQTRETMRTAAELPNHDSELIEFFDSLKQAAQAVRALPRQHYLLKLYSNRNNPDSIHDVTGASIIDERAGIVFWHNHGTFVAPDGAIYRVRTDDTGEAQMYISPVDERGGSIDCIQPFTYDNYISSSGTELRVDFINGRHHVLPTNTLEERMQQYLEKRDVMMPHHSEEISFRLDRDSIILHKLPDGSSEAWLHDCEKGVMRLHSTDDVMAMIAVCDDRDQDASRHKLTV